ncbi:MAG TPA: hypothetical protein VJO34_04025 [Methylomirabilota bacterium]|nr:hypothetical protein [Methylomirabilota bacterium]
MMRVWGAVIVVIALHWTPSAFAQAPQGQSSQGQMEIGVARPQPTAPPLAPELIRPERPEGTTGIREEQYYPEKIRTRHDPAFLRPFTGTFSTGPKSEARAGLSLWTSPIHGASIHSETGGVAAFGFSLVWDQPPSGEAKPEGRQ